MNDQRKWAIGAQGSKDARLIFVGSEADAWRQRQYGEVVVEVKEEFFMTPIRQTGEPISGDCDC